MSHCFREGREGRKERESGPEGSMDFLGPSLSRKGSPSVFEEQPIPKPKMPSQHKVQAGDSEFTFFFFPMLGIEPRALVLGKCSYH